MMSLPPPPPLQSVDTLLEHLTAAGNDLEVVALELVPKIGDVQQALRNTWGCLVVRLSGSGPTSFGLYRDKLLCLRGGGQNRPQPRLVGHGNDARLRPCPFSECG